MPMVSRYFAMISSPESASAEGEIPVTDELVFGNTEEAIGALMVLGYSRQEAQAALKGVDPLLSLEDMITVALRKMMPKF